MAFCNENQNWLAIKSGNITFDQDVECDIQEIRQLIDKAENDSIDNVSPDGGRA